jgi:acetoin utilization deacetylase AcuC-like enzyme
LIARLPIDQAHQLHKCILMKVVFHEAFRSSYCSDPAAADGRMDAVLNIIKDHVELAEASPADYEDIAACHTAAHIEAVRCLGLYNISALAAGAAIKAATIGLKEPCFALVRPPGHHASPGSSWGYCYFNNMAIAISKLKKEGKISRASVLDIDLHFGDGTVNILSTKGYVTVFNPYAPDADAYLKKIMDHLEEDTDIIGISAGFDNHRDDWGSLLSTEDYRKIGQLVRRACRKKRAGCFAIMEGGYNHEVLGHNVLALIEGLRD